MLIKKELKNKMLGKLAAEICSILSCEGLTMLAARGGVANVLQEFRKSLDSVEETDLEKPLL